MISYRPSTDWSLVLGTATLALTAYYFFSSSSKKDRIEEDPVGEDVFENPVLKNFSTFKSYTTSYGTYPRIRSFYRSHTHKEKLQAIADLPLLVFIHGLGGALPQFAPLLGSLINIGPCFGIELPGHGCSALNPRIYNAYSTQAFVALWKVAIDQACNEYGHTKVILIAHSMGGSIAALLATEGKLDHEVVANIALSPKSQPPTQSQSRFFRAFLACPDWIIDCFRWVDRRGDEESTSVERFVGRGADNGLKRLQLKYNAAFKTPAWKRSARGCLADYDAQGKPHGGLPDLDVWQQIQVPLLLIVGEADQVTSTKNVEDIVRVLQHELPQSSSSSNLNMFEISPVPSQTATSNDLTGENNSIADDRSYGLMPVISKTETNHLTSRHSVPVKTAILPAPASHALLYDHATYRTVAGLIEDFLSRYVSQHLSLGWQLTQLTTSGKWDVKNLVKWQRTLAVSAPIPESNPRLNHTHPHGLFRALKTLREQDETHTPSIFIEKWSQAIGAVIDISHDAPVYDTQALERGGIAYFKFPTMSKVPPTVLEVHSFIALVDRVRAEMQKRAEKDRTGSAKAQAKEDDVLPKRRLSWFSAQTHEVNTSQLNLDELSSNPPVSFEVKAIAVHCHYGYNRTGFFICCYLIERLNYSVDKAVEEFARAKPPGIKHDHFIDTLYVRYCIGLKRANTMGLDKIMEKVGREDDEG